MLELGVLADKASMVWEDFNGSLSVLTLEMKNDGEFYTEPSNVVYSPAFTVADLLEKILPDIIVVKKTNMYCLTISCVPGGGWSVFYAAATGKKQIGEAWGPDLIDILCNRIEWLVSNGYKLQE